MVEIETDRRVAFGGFELDLELGELSRAGRPVPLRPLAMRMLTLLVRRRGRLTTREQLRDRLWPGVVLEWDMSLNQCARQIRRALGDSARRPKFVETVPRRGYRFIAEIAPPVAHGRHSGSERRVGVRFASFFAGVGTTLLGLLVLFLGLCALAAAS